MEALEAGKKARVRVSVPRASPRAPRGSGGSNEPPLACPSPFPLEDETSAAEASLGADWPAWEGVAAVASDAFWLTTLSPPLARHAPGKSRVLAECFAISASPLPALRRSQTGDEELLRTHLRSTRWVSSSAYALHLLRRASPREAPALFLPFAAVAGAAPTASLGGDTEAAQRRGASHMPTSVLEAAMGQAAAAALLKAMARTARRNEALEAEVGREVSSRSEVSAAEAREAGEAVPEVALLSLACTRALMEGLPPDAREAGEAAAAALQLLRGLPCASMRARPGGDLKAVMRMAAARARSTGDPGAVALVCAAAAARGSLCAVAEACAALLDLPADAPPLRPPRRALRLARVRSADALPPPWAPAEGSRTPVRLADGTRLEAGGPRPGSSPLAVLAAAADPDRPLVYLLTAGGLRAVSTGLGDDGVRRGTVVAECADAAVRAWDGEGPPVLSWLACAGGAVFLRQATLAAASARPELPAPDDTLTVFRAGSLERIRATPLRRGGEACALPDADAVAAAVAAGPGPIYSDGVHLCVLGQVCLNPEDAPQPRDGVVGAEAEAEEEPGASPASPELVRSESVASASSAAGDGDDAEEEKKAKDDDAAAAAAASDGDDGTKTKEKKEEEEEEKKRKKKNEQAEAEENKEEEPEVEEQDPRRYVTTVVKARVASDGSGAALDGAPRAVALDGPTAGGSGDAGVPQAVYGFGTNGSGQLGLPLASDSPLERAEQVREPDRRWAFVAACGLTTVLLSTEGEAFLAGAAQFPAEEEERPRGSVASPARITAGVLGSHRVRFAAVSARGRTVAFITADGRVALAGRDPLGARVASPPRFIDSQPGGPAVWAAVAQRQAAGYVTEDGRAFTWGGGGTPGRFGHATADAVEQPAEVPGLPPVAQMVLLNGGCLFLSRDGALFACGNLRHALRPGAAGGGSATPYRIDMPEPLAQVVSSSRSTLCVGRSGALYAFGANDAGCLGFGPRTRTVRFPTPVSALKDLRVRRVATNGRTTVVVTAAGSVHALGAPGDGIVAAAVGPRATVSSLHGLGIVDAAVGDGYAVCLSGSGPCAVPPAALGACLVYGRPTAAAVSALPGAAALLSARKLRERRRMLHRVFPLADGARGRGSVSPADPEWAVVGPARGRGRPATDRLALAPPSGEHEGGVAACYNPADGCTWAFFAATGELRRFAPFMPPPGGHAASRDRDPRWLPENLLSQRWAVRAADDGLTPLRAVAMTLSSVGTLWTLFVSARAKPSAAGGPHLSGWEAVPDLVPEPVAARQEREARDARARRGGRSPVPPGFPDGAAPSSMLARALNTPAADDDSPVEALTALARLARESWARVRELEREGGAEKQGGGEDDEEEEEGGELRLRQFVFLRSMGLLLLTLRPTGTRPCHRRGCLAGPALVSEVCAEHAGEMTRALPASLDDVGRLLGGQRSFVGLLEEVECLSSESGAQPAATEAGRHFRTEARRLAIGAMSALWLQAAPTWADRRAFLLRLLGEASALAAGDGGEDGDADKERRRRRTCAVHAWLSVACERLAAAPGCQHLAGGTAAGAVRLLEAAYPAMAWPARAPWSRRVCLLVSCVLEHSFAAAALDAVEGRAAELARLDDVALQLSPPGPDPLPDARRWAAALPPAPARSAALEVVTASTAWLARLVTRHVAGRGSWDVALALRSLSLLSAFEPTPGLAAGLVPALLAALPVLPSRCSPPAADGEAPPATATGESRHPYRPCVREAVMFKFKGSSRYAPVCVVEFDPLTSLADPNDRIRVLETGRRGSSSDRCVVELTGSSPRAAFLAPHVVFGRTVTVELLPAARAGRPDAGGGRALDRARYGFRCTVTCHFTRSLSNPMEIAANSMTAAVARVGAGLARAPRVSPERLLWPDAPVLTRRSAQAARRLLSLPLVRDALDALGEGGGRGPREEEAEERPAAAEPARCERMRGESGLPDPWLTGVEAVDGAELVVRVRDWRGRPVPAARVIAAGLVRAGVGAVSRAPLAPDWFARVTSAAGRPVPEPLTQTACAAVPGGVLVFGGFSRRNADSRSVYWLDAATGEFARRASLPVASRSAAAVPLPDGSVLVAGGTGALCARYLAADDAWEDVPPPPGRPLGWGVRGCADASGVAHFSGGEGGTSRHLVYDPQAGAWHECAPLPHGASSHGMACVGGRVFLLGGVRATREVWSVRAADAVASARAATEAGGAPDPVPWRREAWQVHDGGACSAAVVASGAQIVVAGGSTVHGNHQPPYFGDVRAYDTRTGSCEVLGALPRPVRAPSACVVGGRLHVFGGSNGRPRHEHHTFEAGDSQRAGACGTRAQAFGGVALGPPRARSDGAVAFALDRRAGAREDVDLHVSVAGVDAPGGPWLLRRGAAAAEPAGEPRPSAGLWSSPRACAAVDAAHHACAAAWAAARVAAPERGSADEAAAFARTASAVWAYIDRGRGHDPEEAADFVAANASSLAALLEDADAARLRLGDGHTPASPSSSATVARDVLLLVMPANGAPVVADPVRAVAEARERGGRLRRAGFSALVRLAACGDVAGAADGTTLHAGAEQALWHATSALEYDAVRSWRLRSGLAAPATEHAAERARGASCQSPASGDPLRWAAHLALPGLEKVPPLLWRGVTADTPLGALLCGLVFYARPREGSRSWRHELLWERLAAHAPAAAEAARPRKGPGGERRQPLWHTARDAARGARVYRSTDITARVSFSDASWHKARAPRLGDESPFSYWEGAPPRVAASQSDPTSKARDWVLLEMPGEVMLDCLEVQVEAETDRDHTPSRFILVLVEGPRAARGGGRPVQVGCEHPTVSRRTNGFVAVSPTIYPVSVTRMRLCLEGSLSASSEPLRLRAVRVRALVPEPGPSPEEASRGRAADVRLLVQREGLAAAVRASWGGGAAGERSEAARRAWSWSGRRALSGHGGDGGRGFALGPCPSTARATGTAEPILRAVMWTRSRDVVEAGLAALRALFGGGLARAPASAEAHGAVPLLLESVRRGSPAAARDALHLFAAMLPDPSPAALQALFRTAARAWERTEWQQAAPGGVYVVRERSVAVPPPPLPAAGGDTGADTAAAAAAAEWQRARPATSLPAGYAPLVPETAADVTLECVSTGERVAVSVHGAVATHVHKFPTVAPAGLAVSSGRWYFEVEVMSVNVLQVGWATAKSFAPGGDTMGVGDCAHSWAFDGYRSVSFHRAESFAVKDAFTGVGDRVGCALDLERFTMAWYVNGRRVCSRFEGFADAEKVAAEGGLRPCVSLGGPAGQVRFCLRGSEMLRTAHEADSWDPPRLALSLLRQMLRERPAWRRLMLAELGPLARGRGNDWEAATAAAVFDARLDLVRLDGGATCLALGGRRAAPVPPDGAAAGVPLEAFAGAERPEAAAEPDEEDEDEDEEEKEKGSEEAGPAMEREELVKEEERAADEADPGPRPEPLSEPSPEPADATATRAEAKGGGGSSSASPHPLPPPPPSSHAVWLAAATAGVALVGALLWAWRRRK